MEELLHPPLVMVLLGVIVVAGLVALLLMYWLSDGGDSEADTSEKPDDEARRP